MTLKSYFFAKANKNNLHTIFLHLEIGSSKEYKTTGISIPKENWSAQSQRIDGLNELGDSYNNRLMLLASNYQNEYLKLLLQKKPFSLNDLIQAVENDFNGYTLNQCLQDYLKYCIEVEQLHTETIKKHGFLIKNIQSFINNKTFFAESIDISFLSKLKIFIIKIRKCKIDHASRHAEHIKKALEFAVMNNKIKSHNLHSFKSERSPVKELVYLTSAEFLKWFCYNSEFTLKQKVANLYLLQCCTGISFGDLQRFHFNAVENIQLIEGNRLKKGRKFLVILFEITQKVLARFNGKIPKITNQVYNRTLKIIANELGIKKRLTTHTGRKTFSVLRYEEGWSIETIAAMLGHASTSPTIKHYIHFNSVNRIINEYNRLNKAS